MKEEEIKAAEEAKAAEDAQAAEEAAKTNKDGEGANQDEDKKNLIEEVKKLRTERATYKELYEKEASQKKDEDKEPNAVAIEVEKVLKEKELSRAKDNKKSALDRFISEHKEFHEDNDIAGIKQQALRAKFEMFNTEGLVEVEQFYSVIKDAYRLLAGVDKQPETIKENPYSSTSPNFSFKKNDGEQSKLTGKEKILAERNNWPDEKIIKLREKHPDMLENLLQFVRD